MLFKFETDGVLMPVHKDKRRKLSPDQKQAIRESDPAIPDKILADEYNVSRRMIGFIRRPETLAANKLARELRGGWAQYYDKDKHADYMREHRRYKRDVLKDGAELKLCTFCDKLKLESSFRSGKCDACSRKYRKAAETYLPDVKCSVCQVFKPIDQFKARRAGRCNDCQDVHAKELLAKKNERRKTKGSIEGFCPTFQDVLSKKW